MSGLGRVFGEACSWDGACRVGSNLRVPLAWEEEELHLALPLAGCQPPQTASEEAQETWRPTPSMVLSPESWHLSGENHRSIVTPCLSSRPCVGAAETCPALSSLSGNSPLPFPRTRCPALETLLSLAAQWPSVLMASVTFGNTVTPKLCSQPKRFCPINCPYLDAFFSPFSSPASSSKKPPPTALLQVA